MTESTLSPLDWADGPGRGISGTLKAATFVCCNLISRFGSRLNVQLLQYPCWRTQLQENVKAYGTSDTSDSSELLDTVIVLYQLVFYFKQAAICSIVYASNLIKSYPIFRINFAIFYCMVLLSGAHLGNRLKTDCSDCKWYKFLARNSLRKFFLKWKTVKKVVADVNKMVVV